MLTIVDQNNQTEKHPLTELFSALLYDLIGIRGGGHQLCQLFCVVAVRESTMVFTLGLCCNR